MKELTRKKTERNTKQQNQLNKEIRIIRTGWTGTSIPDSGHGLYLQSSL